MATVRYTLKRPHAPTTAIIAIARHKGSKAKFSTGISIEPRHWNQRKQKVHIAHLPAAAAAINAKLTELRDKILALTIKADQLPSRAEIHGNPTASKSLPALARAHGLQLTSTGHAPKTATNYNTLATNIHRFAGDIQLSKINTAWLDEFRRWLYTQDYSDSHIRKTLVTLKTTLQGHKPTLAAHIQPPSARHRDEIYLTNTEIQQIQSLQLHNQRLHRARNQLLLACHTGQRYSDLAQIRPERITDQILHITQQKGSRNVEIPVSTELRAIIEQNTPLYRTNQELNRLVKTVARLAGITQKVEITIYKAGRAHVKQFEKWQLVKSHTGRRSFATNALLADIPPHVIRQFTGHRTEQEFWRYIRASGREIAEKFRSHPFFTGKQ